MAPCGWMGALVLGRERRTSWPLQQTCSSACRALPVMYAVALDLRIFANNVSSVFVTVLLKLKLRFCLLLNFMSSSKSCEG